MNDLCVRAKKVNCLSVTWQLQEIIFDTLFVTHLYFKVLSYD